MTPNLFVATQTLFSPHKWFKNRPKGERLARKTEHWDTPVPGIYEYIPGRGWYLIATDKEVPANVDPDIKSPDDQSTPTPKTPFPNGSKQEVVRMTSPVQVKYSKVLKRYLLAPDYELRKKHGKIQSAQGKWYDAGFFRLDDGIAWVECWDDHGEFIPGPYKLWCIDTATGKFRHMLKGDDPKYVPSRQNSARGRSQDSRSTQFRSGAGSTRDGASVPSSRANSIKSPVSGLYTPSAPTSRSTSQANSRRESPKRSPLASPRVPLEEAKERLRAMAAAQAAAATTATDKSRVDSLEDRRPGRLAVKRTDTATKMENDGKG
ncbi:hypothetical protein K491DRAFT_607969 [Lophiostoma macrostomum CBS 122681]|uniref:Uncharacterized protein n=1 Tax=Lophiostoma macrostomum CBS 122681 TaxID=1314788 RepID=A0A6A6ST99_9PLEO|nr:hypothetical protein K491DRAFT_607969 [Lophiostoma macrostomum CBS 122681]